METKKQTAVEWLVDEIEKHYIINNGSLDPTVVMELKRQAIEMEKEQIIDANEDCSTNELGELLTGEQYYNETYGK